MKLSIQLSLNGLSFCTLDPYHQEVTRYEHLDFGWEIDTQDLGIKLSQFIGDHQIDKYTYQAIQVVHTNHLFGVVPQSLFDPQYLNSYVKYNTALLANDTLSHDLIQPWDIQVVYVPFANANNLIFDRFGSFEYHHHTELLFKTLRPGLLDNSESTLLIHLQGQLMTIMVFQGKKLLLVNVFKAFTEEDFMYYLLFVGEQIQLDIHKTQFIASGALNENHPYWLRMIDHLGEINNCTVEHAYQFAEHLDPKGIDPLTLTALF